MKQETQTMIERALELPYEERAVLEEALYESLHAGAGSGALDENDPRYEAEISRRISEVQSGAVQAMTWDEVKATLLSKQAQ